MEERSSSEQIRQLVEKARRGDARALGILCETHRGLVYGICLRWCGNAADADDLAQESLIRALTCLGQLREPERVSGWICAVASNVCRNYLARERRQTIALDDCPAIAMSGPSPEAEAVREALRSLPPAVRDTIELFYLDGHSRSELASILGVPDSTVRSRLSAGCRALRKELREMGFTFDAKMLSEDVVLPSAGVMVADTDMIAARGAQTLLESNGFNVRVVTDLAVVVARLRRYHPGILVVSGGSKPDHALDALYSVRVDKNLRSTSVLVLLARPVSEGDLVRVWEAGADCCLAQPYDPSEFVRFVQTLDGGIRAGAYCELAVEHAWRRETDQTLRYLRRAVDLPGGLAAIKSSSSNPAFGYLRLNEEFRRLTAG